MLNLAIKHFSALPISVGKEIKSDWQFSNLTYKFKTDLVVGDHIDTGGFYGITWIKWYLEYFFRLY